MIQSVVGADAQLQLSAGFSEPERPVQRRIQADLIGARNGIAPGITELPGNGQGESGCVEKSS